MNKKLVRKMAETFSKYNKEDPMSYKNLLTEEELEIQEVARKFFEERLMPTIVKDYREKHFDKQIMKDLGKMGFLGCTIEGYGGSGLSYL